MGRKENSAHTAVIRKKGIEDEGTLGQVWSSKEETKKFEDHRSGYDL